MEEWRKWEVENVPKGEYEIMKIVQDIDGTRIEMEDDVNTIQVIYGFVLGIRIFDEGTRLKTIMETQHKHSDRGFFVNWPFYKVEDSELKKWIVEESYKIYEHHECMHIAIVTPNDVVDILSTYEPTIIVTSIT